MAKSKDKNEEQEIENNDELYEDVWESKKERCHWNDLPGVCKHCGGPYPLCEDGCSIFDN